MIRGSDEGHEEAHMPEAYIYDHVRTPRGRGKPAEHHVVHLPRVEAVAVLERAQRRLGEAQRRHLVQRTVGTHVPGVQINRFCASGLDAINFAAAQVMAGQHDLTVGGGVESMSRVGLGPAA
jgi:acetyl-CoA C-acetyltransferase